MGKGELFYYCSVSPVQGNPQLNPGKDYRLDLRGAALQAPAHRGYSAQAVATGSEMDELRRRGFDVSVLDGPFTSQEQAENCLDSAWEEPD